MCDSYLFLDTYGHFPYSFDEAHDFSQQQAMKESRRLEQEWDQ